MLCMPRLNLFTGEFKSIHVLVEFVEEDSNTAIVPIQHYLDLEDLESVQAGERITVLWYDGKKYPAVFLTSGQYLELLYFAWEDQGKISTCVLGITLHILILFIKCIMAC